MENLHPKRLVSILVIGIMQLFGCNADEDRTSPQQPIGVLQTDSASETPVERETLSVADSPVLTEEALEPIVSNPATEATGNMSIGHCDVRDTDNLCIDFTGSGWTGSQALAECANASGSSFENNACPAGGRVGTCVIHPNGNAALEMIHTFYEPMPLVLAEGVCPGRFEAEVPDQTGS